MTIEIILRKQNKKKFKMQHAFWKHEIFIFLFNSQTFENEIMLRKDFVFFDENDIINRQTNIEMTYNNAFLLQRYVSNNIFICRFILNKRNWLQFFAYFSSLKAELKLNTYNREYFLNHFDVVKNNKCIFLFYFFFLNEFEFYRNFYRNLIKMYLQFVAFNFHEEKFFTNKFF